ncbi:MAG: hypothetical protein IPI20_07370 [Rhodoferax sp.]|nr:hypothetical protein [Rhodoferax sp.]
MDHLSGPGRCHRVFAWVSTHGRARAIAELPTSRIGSAAQGYVELYGRASVDPDNLITSPFSGVSCIWYRCRTYSKDNNDREWREVSCNVSEATFEIRDPTGACRVDPDHAEVMGPEVRTTYSGGYKQVEEMLFGGGLIYVLGEFSTVGGAHSALSLVKTLARYSRIGRKIRKGSNSASIWTVTEKLTCASGSWRGALRPEPSKNSTGRSARRPVFTSCARQKQTSVFDFQPVTAKTAAALPVVELPASGRAGPRPPWRR